MANASSEAVNPKDNYDDGGRQSCVVSSHANFNGNIWLTIKDFLVWSETKKEKFSFKSLPVEFVFGQRTYKFLLQIDLTNKQEDNIGVYLCKLNQDELSIAFEICALNSSGDSFKKQLLTKKFETGWGFPNFLSKKNLKENAETHLPNGALKLKCNLTVYVDEISTVQNEVSRLSNNLHNLWTERVLQDFNIKCEGEDFLCHRAVLAARSDVFKVMLSTESIEKQRGEVEVKDCSAETLRLFLEFVYSDCLRKDSDYISTELLILADRYQVAGLKNTCEVALSKTMSKDDAIQLLSTASLYSAKVLMSNAARVVANNLKELVGSEDWKQMVATNPRAMEAIIKTSL
jgi:speckle-type POZ protein